ncbi:hypothetical protein EYF80_064374 [Liparis tanakae]|uniref:Uncharacterized protein n=1 Tax=Liparis tanakae TaxID=230148 RepID=A0A4Z2E9Q9_9TELE|nr:hypothetical protein EYF80_064374 [Liparis tanakae]
MYSTSTRTSSRAARRASLNAPRPQRNTSSGKIQEFYFENPQKRSSPCREPMALCTHLHTCSSSSTLSMGECVRRIRTSFCFTRSTSRPSGTPVRTPSRSMAPSPFRRSRFRASRRLLPSRSWAAARAFSRWDLRGRSTQENMARSSARSEDTEALFFFFPPTESCSCICVFI